MPKLIKISFLYEDKELFLSAKEAEKFVAIVTEAQLNGAYRKLKWRKIDLSFKAETLEVINYFNKITGKIIKNDPVTKSTAQPIISRLKEGYAVDQLKTVIDIKSAQWKNDPKMKEFLRPVTLFSKKFESYLIQGHGQVKTKADKELEELRK